jgi:acyl-CoA:acyl-CoA alkyltransferase
LRARISGVGHWLPPTRLASSEVERRVSAASRPFEMPRGLIKLVSGVEHRHFADPPLSSADLAAKAATAALDNAGVDADDVDLLMFASASGAVLEPATSNLVQEQVGCPNARVFDVKNACNSVLDALDIAQTFVEADRYQRILIAAGEVNSPAITWRIRDRAELARFVAALTLGDAGGACLVEGTDDPQHRLFPGRFISRGCHWRLSVVMSGGTLLREDFSRCALECDSLELQRVGLELIPDVVNAALESVGWRPDDVALVVPHQMSGPAIDLVCEVIGLDPARCVKTLRHCGNTAAASLPLGLSLALRDGRLAKGDKVLLAAASAGFSAGVIPVVWS